MYSRNYDYIAINAVKLIVTNPAGRVLLIQEPENNDWMPLHWGLPGGKPAEKESLKETLERKSKTDVGQHLNVQGILEIEELLVKGKTVMMYTVLAKAASNKVQGEAKKHKWVDKKDVEKMKIEDFTEFFNKELILNFFEDKLKLIPLETINTLKYYKIKDNPNYKKWFDSGNK